MANKRTVATGLTLTAIAGAFIVAGTIAFAALASEPGRFVVWGSEGGPPNGDPLVAEGAPSGDFVSLAAGGAQQTLAIRADRTLELNEVSGQAPPIPPALEQQEFCAAGIGRLHGLAIRRDGSIAAWPDEASTGVPPVGQFVAVTGAAAYYSVALDTNGNIVQWGGGNPPPGKTVVAPPIGRFQAVAARLRYALALSEDGTLYGWGTAGANFPAFTSAAGGWTADSAGHFIAPTDPNNRYTAIDAGLDLVVALRADGSVAQWATQPMPDPPTSIVFTQVAAGAGFASAIDEWGRLHSWGTAPWIVDVATGIYSAVSAATSHVSAIEAPRHFLWPPNHEMATIVLTFRADENCAPAPLSALSIELRSNQPDTGSGSGNTTGDTNGQDGYTAPVILPAAATTQNGDGSFTATFQLRAERSSALSGSRIYTVAVVLADSEASPNTSTRTVAQIRVESGQ